MMKAAGALLASPALYRAALPLADSALRHLPRFIIYNRLNAWGRGREVPHAPKLTFHQWYKESRGAKQ
jgi:L-lactate dehydrogenase complex protein LldF